MRKYFLPLIFLASFLHAQDTTKLLNYEIGVNAVGLIKQAISNTPTLALEQLPYTVFYNLNYKQIAGLRLGFGFYSDYFEVEIPGQQLPRVTDVTELNLRVGGNYYVVNTKRIKINLFADYVREHNYTQTLNTVTVQVFPNPRQTITTEITDKVRGEGFQAGAGIYWHPHKNVSLYTETPFTYMSRVFHSNYYIDDTGESSETSTTSRRYTGKFYLPTTIYLVLRF